MADMDMRVLIEVAKDILRAKEVLTGCTSYVQRKLGIGYNQGAFIMRQLEEKNFITPADKVGARSLVERHCRVAARITQGES